MKVKNISSILVLITLSACNANNLTTIPKTNPEVEDTKINNKVETNKPIENTNQKESTFSLKDSNLSLIVDQSFNFLDTITLSNNIKIDSLKFTSSNTDILTIDEKGKILPLKSGKVILKIEVKDKPSEFKECKIEIKEKENILITPVSIKINEPTNELKVEDKYTLSATVKYSDNKSDNDVLWKTSDESIATINNLGELLALNKGTVNITATSKQKKEIFTNISLNISEKVVIIRSSGGGGGSSSGGTNSSPSISLSKLKGELLSFNSPDLSSNGVFLFNGDGSNLRKITLPFTEVKQVFLSNSKNNLLFVGDNTVRTSNIDGNRVVHIRDGNLSNPVFSSDGSKILYTEQNDSNKNILISAFHGSNLYILTTSNNCRDASFLLNDKVVYVNDDFNINIMDSDGSNKINLYNSLKTVYFPINSPDGNKIAFIQKDDDTTFNIYTVNIDGSNLVNVTKNPLGSGIKINNILKWSQDSQKIFYTSTKRGEGLYVSNVDASAYLKLPINFSSAQSCCDSLTGKIIYTSDKEGTNKTYFKTLDNNTEITVFNGESKNASIFYNRNKYLLVNDDGIYWGLDESNTITKVENTTSDSNYPEWTPDSRIIYGNNSGYVFLSNIQGSSVSPIPLGNQKNSEFEFGPDGIKIAYTIIKTDETNQHIYTMNANTTNKIQLTSIGNNYAPSWSPNGTKIAFDSDRSGRREIYIMNADGTNQTMLTSEGGYEPKWSPDGKKIAFTNQVNGKKSIYWINSDGSNIERLLGDSNSNYYLKTWK
jgi:Tol biopolymer transport system component